MVASVSTAEWAHSVYGDGSMVWWEGAGCRALHSGSRAAGGANSRYCAAVQL